MAALAITYLGFTTARYVVHEYNLRDDQATLHQQIDQLDRDHEKLVAVRDYLKSDEYIEDVARRVLGLVRPGETLVVVSSSAPPAATSPTAAAPTTRTPTAEWWKDLFVQPAPVFLAKTLSHLERRLAAGIDGWFFILRAAARMQQAAMRKQEPADC